MHGAHPGRLAFKLRDLSLFLLRILPSSLSYVLRRRSCLTSISFLSHKMSSGNPRRALFQLRHWNSRSSSRTARSNVLFPFSSLSLSLCLTFSPLFIFSSQQHDKDAHVLPRPRKGRLLGETDTGWVTGQQSAGVLGITEIPKLYTNELKSQGKFLLKIELQ